MPKNVEIKARVHDLSTMLKEASELSGSTGEVLHQEDVFYNSPNGRLKLRTIKGVKEELIYYDRPDQDGPKSSDFMKIDGKIGDLTSKFSCLLEKSMGIKGKVKKKRTLFIVDQTRIHVDEVEGLGSFMELEVMLSENQDVESGEATARTIMNQLCISKEDLISCAYMDLLLK